MKRDDEHGWDEDPLDDLLNWASDSGPEPADDEWPEETVPPEPQDEEWPPEEPAPEPPDDDWPEEEFPEASVDEYRPVSFPPARAASDPKPRRVPIRRGLRRAELDWLGTPTEKSPSPGYLEVELLREHAHTIDWETVAPAPGQDSRDALSEEQRFLVEALFELRVLSETQIHREFLVSIGDRQLRRELKRLRAAGIVRRGRLYGPHKYGRGEWIYVLAGQGLSLLREAHDHPYSGKWRPSLGCSAQYLVHDLIRNEWLFAFRSLAPRQLLGFRGTRRGKLEVPWVPGSKGPGRALRPTDLVERPAIGLLSDGFANIIPDLTLELDLALPGEEELKTDLLVEIERRNNDEAVRDKALRYDGFLNGWWREHPRYSALGRPPMVVFVVPDLRQARRFKAIFDKALQGHQVVPPGTQTRAENELGLRPSTTELYFGRERIFIAAARDVHYRTLRAWRVRAEPPEKRMRMAPNAEARRTASRPLVRVSPLIDQRWLINPAT